MGIMNDSSDNGKKMNFQVEDLMVLGEGRASLKPGKLIP
jgi:hypothetical protein